MNIDEIKIEIGCKEREKGIRRKHVENEVKETEKVGKFAIHHTIKSTIQAEKLKLIRFGYPLITDAEAIRYAMEKELQNNFDKKNIGKGYHKLEPLRLKLPYIVQIGEYKNLYRVDIKACFYSIYSKAGIDARCKFRFHSQNEIEYITMAKGIITKENSQVIYELEHQKKLRNTLYGLTRSCFVQVFYPVGRWERQFFKGKLLNPELHALISLILNSFVNEINRKSIIYYWNIDGGFIKTENILDIVEIAEKYGFSIKTEKAKEVIIKRLGGYMWIDEYGLIHETGHMKWITNHSQNLQSLHVITNSDKLTRDWSKLCLK